jgi:hypothetical protein
VIVPHVQTSQHRARVSQKKVGKDNPVNQLKQVEGEAVRGFMIRALRLLFQPSHPRI